MLTTHLSGVEDGAFLAWLGCLRLYSLDAGKGRISGCYLDPSARESLCLSLGRHASSVSLIGLGMELRALNQSILYIFKTCMGSSESCHLRNGKADLRLHVPHH